MPPSATVPQFTIKLYKLKIPSLQLMSDVLGKDVKIKLCNYSKKFSEVLLKHLTSETEVQIVNGSLTDESQESLQLLKTEMSVLQYRSNLRNILDAWALVLLGQPVYPDVHNYLHDLRADILEMFETYIYDLQNHATRKMRSDNKQLCSKACKNVSQIMNLTEANISPELDLMFKNGPNMVPSDALKTSEIIKHIENDLIMSATKFSWD